MQRILVTFDNREDSNWGSQATTSCLFQMLQERYPEAEIKGLRRDAMHHVRHFRSMLSTLLPQAITRPTLLNRRSLAAALRPFAHLEHWPDLIVVNGEGTLHNQTQALLWLPVVFALAESSRAKLHIVNATIRPGGTDFDPLLQRVFERAEHVVLREPSYATELKAMGAKLRAGADAACLAEPDTVAATSILDKKEIQGSYAILTGAANGRDWKIESARPAVDDLRKLHPRWIFCASTRTDRLLHERLAPDMPLVTETDLSYPGLVALIAGADLHVGGRYHPTLFALQHGTPVVAIASNTNKIQGLASHFAAQFPVISHEDLGRLADHAEAGLNRGRQAQSEAERTALIHKARLNVWPEQG